MPTTLPTRLPHTAARAGQHHRPLIAELASIAVAILYLLLLAWNVASLATSVDLLFGHDLRQDAYNPMEPGHPIAARRNTAEEAR
jgi:hypothetical protein